MAFNTERTPTTGFSFEKGRSMSSAALSGFSLCGSLIVAIGAQNAFVLNQGIRRNRPLLIALFCIASDALLIGIGVAGVGQVFAANPLWIRWATWLGAVSLFIYGGLSLRSAFTNQSLVAEGPEYSALKPLLATAFAVTYLNPHAYLDTVVLMGGLSSRFAAPDRLFFWAGAVTASSLWFLGLSLGGRVLAPLFEKNVAWRILDSGICLVMWAIAFSLVLQGLAPI